MALWKKILFGILLVSLLLSVGVYVLLLNKSQAMFDAWATGFFNSPVSAAKVTPVFPAGIAVDGLMIEGRLSARSARLVIDVPAALRGHLQVRTLELRGAALRVFRSADGEVSIPLARGAASASGAPAMPEDRQVSVLSELLIADSALEFVDQSAGKTWILRDVNGRVNNLPLTSGVSRRTKLSLTCSLSEIDLPFVGNFVKASGWVDWAGRNMDVLVQAMDDDGRINFDAKLASQSNRLAVTGHARLTGSQQKQALGRETGLTESVVLTALDSFRTEVQAEYSFETAMDRFEVGKVTIKGELQSESESSGTPGQLIENLRVVGEEILKAGN